MDHFKLNKEARVMADCESAYQLARQVLLLQEENQTLRRSLESKSAGTTAMNDTQLTNVKQRAC